MIIRSATYSPPSRNKLLLYVRVITAEGGRSHSAEVLEAVDGQVLSQTGNFNTTVDEERDGFRVGFAIIGVEVHMSSQAQTNFIRLPFTAVCVAGDGPLD
jgi:hypothetical protein